MVLTWTTFQSTFAQTRAESGVVVVTVAEGSLLPAAMVKAPMPGEPWNFHAWKACSCALALPPGR
jgi:hypothetical protein